MMLRHIRKIGNSYSFLIPKAVSDMLDIDGDTVMYSYLDGNKVVYSKNFRPDAQKVKVRTQVRLRGKEYYSITIPMKFARKLEIEEGDIAGVELLDDGFSITKVHKVQAYHQMKASKS